MNRELSCPLCYFLTKDPRKCICHLLNKHKGEALYNVQCSVSGCKYTAKTWVAYKQHCRQKHKITASNVIEEYLSSDEEIEIQENVEMQEHQHSDVKKMFVKFLLDLEAGSKVSSSNI